MENNEFETINLNKSNNSSNAIKVLIIIVIILGVIILSLSLYLIFKESNDDVQSNKQQLSQVRDGKKLKILEDQRYKSIYDEKIDEKDGYNEYNITCKTDNCKIASNLTGEPSGKNGYVFINDGNELILYNYVTDRYIETFKDIKDFLFGDDFIVLTNNRNQGIYNLYLEKLTVPFEYEFEQVGYWSLDTRGIYYDVVLGNGIVASKNGKYGIINYETGDAKLDFMYDNVLCYTDESEHSYELMYNRIYCKAVKNNKVTIYSYTQNSSKETKIEINLNDFYGFVDKYGLGLLNNKFVIVDLYDNSIVTTYDSFNPKYNYFFSDYYEDENNDKNILTQFNSGNTCVEYYYNLRTKENHFKDNVDCGDLAKPILYLYPEKETNVTVSFEHNNLLTTTYPKFVNEWNVLAKSNGDLYDKNGKYYYGLYWEEQPIHRVNFDTGFYVEKNNVIEFLEEKLSYIGLNNKERNEFIMYWLPILEKNEKNLIYFELTDERENVNKININPKPDSLLRIVMHVKKVNKKTNIKEQKLKSFERKGFTVVEWGGYNYIK